MFEFIGMFLLGVVGAGNMIVLFLFYLAEKEDREARREAERNMNAEEKRMKRKEEQKKQDIFEIKTSIRINDYKNQAVEFLWSYFSIQSAGVKWRPVTEDTLLKFKEMIIKTDLCKEERKLQYMNKLMEKMEGDEK